MPLVTQAITRLTPNLLDADEKVVKNVGANPVEVSKDPAIVFGTADNFNLAAGAEERIELQTGEALYAVCGAGLQSQVDVI